MPIVAPGEYRRIGVGGVTNQKNSSPSPYRWHHQPFVRAIADPYRPDRPGNVVAEHPVTEGGKQYRIDRSHLVTALAVEAVRAGKSVYFIPARRSGRHPRQGCREGVLREKIRFLCRSSLFVVDERS